MGVEAAGNTGFLDPEMLQRQEVTPSVQKSKLYFIEELLSQWLSLPETGLLVKSLIADAKSGAPLNLAGNSTDTNDASCHSLPSSFSGGSKPPLSPLSLSGSPRIVKQRVIPSSSSSPLELVNEPVRETIPQFYFKSGRPPPDDMKLKFLGEVNKFFSSNLDGVQIDEFKTVTMKICWLPSFLSTTLFRKIDINCNGSVSREQFTDYWISRNMLTIDLETRVYTILKESDRNYLVQDDFKPVLQEITAAHPALGFLQGVPQLRKKYAETVIYRIFYYINRSSNGRLTLRELKRGDLIAVMQDLDEELDINKIPTYFSYKHVYVIYSKFWELDDDLDCFIDKDDLIKYGDHTLSHRIVERVFSQVPRKFTSKVKGKMGYEDFVYFIMAEEHKSSEPSIEYWFKCIDLDGDGVLTRNELQFFYYQRLQPMEGMAPKPVLFENILYQIFDMIGLKNEECITLRDLKGCELAGTVFNILFNPKKYYADQNRQASLIRQEHEDQTWTEWEHFAQREFIRLSKKDFKDVEENVEDVKENVEDVKENDEKVEGDIKEASNGK